MRWLLDTNTVSETIRPRPHPAVTRWLAEISPAVTAISIVTLAELTYGASVAQKERHRTRIAHWLADTVVPSFADRTLPLTSEILVGWLELSHQLGRRRITRAATDMLIASTARVHDLTVVTRNVRDFADTGIVVYDPWNNQTHRMDAP